MIEGEMSLWRTNHFLINDVRDTQSFYPPDVMCFKREVVEGREHDGIKYLTAGAAPPAGMYWVFAWLVCVCLIKKIVIVMALWPFMTLNENHFCLL